MQIYLMFKLVMQIWRVVFRQKKLLDLRMISVRLKSTRNWIHKQIYCNAIQMKLDIRREKKEEKKQLRRTCDEFDQIELNWFSSLGDIRQNGHFNFQ